MEDEEMKTQLESARGLIEKFVFENEKLIEKVNSLNGEMTTTDDPMVTNSEVDDETSDTETTTDDKIMESMKKDDVNRVSMASGEIVQIPLDESDVLLERKGGGDVDVDMDVVPLIDAPLIGAPFRFISLVARYVSGADLVEKT